MRFKAEVPAKRGLDLAILENSMMAAFTVIGDHIAREAKERVKRKSGHLADNITVGEPTVDDKGVYSIAVGTSGVPYAMALEFGSGLYKEGGGGEKYPIVPVRAKALAFPWANHPVGMTPNKDGLFFFQKVMHPGIKPQPYLRPAFRFIRPFAVNLINNAVLTTAKKGLKHANPK